MGNAGKGKPILDKEGKVLRNPVRFAEKELVTTIRCADGVDYVAKFAVSLVTQMNKGVFHRYFTTKGRRSASAMEMHKWIQENQTQYPSSIYQCIKP